MHHFYFLFLEKQAKERDFLCYSIELQAYTLEVLLKKKHLFMVASLGPYPIDQTKLNNTPSVPSLDCLFFFFTFLFYSKAYSLRCDQILILRSYHLSIFKLSNTHN